MTLRSAARTQAVAAAPLPAPTQRPDGRAVRDVVAVAPVQAGKIERRPFREACFYQIYPRSFADGNGDGIGDLKGITDRLDHVKDLGVDTIWLSPIFASPNDDNGYDISDYKAVMPEFGTMADFEAMTAKAKRLGLKIVLDLVVNHTSDEHEWFQESMKDRTNPKADWYIWKDPKPDGSAPNNWRSNFGGSAWKFSPERGQYFLHLYSKKQPDLNWENPAVREACFDVMHFWKDRGCDGFRMDVINEIGKPEDFADTATGQFKANLDKTHGYLQEMNEKVLSKYPDFMSVGEMPGVNPQEARQFTDPSRKELQMVFGFEHIGAGIPAGQKWSSPQGTFSVKEFKTILNNWDKGIGDGWNTMYFGNHDWQRMTSHFVKNQAYRELGAKALQTVLYTGRWTPYLLAGDEIGMVNTTFKSIADVRDIESINYYNEQVAAGMAPETALAHINVWSRDHARTPMQWDGTPGAGFGSTKTWIDVNPSYTEINVDKQAHDPKSVLSYCKNVVALRKENPVLVYGSHEMLALDDDQAYACLRTLGDEKVLVLANLSDQEADVELPAEINAAKKTLILGNRADSGSVVANAGKLGPYEARIMRLEPLSPLAARIVR